MCKGDFSLLRCSGADLCSSRCADRDMHMQYLGGGIGHWSATTDPVEESLQVEDTGNDLEMLEAANDDVNEAQAFMDHPSQLDDLEQLNEEDYMQDNIEQPGDVLNDELDNYDYTQELKDSNNKAMSVSMDGGDLGPEDGKDYHDDKQFDSDIENGYED